jgi:hypothetical protein
MEFQKRGAVHYNVELSTVPVLDELREEWYNVVGSGDKKHRERGVWIQEITTWTGLQEYLVWELCKKHQKELPAGVSGVGRWWGYWGIKKEQAIKSIQGREAITIARQVRKGVNADRRAKCWEHQRPFHMDMRKIEEGNVEFHAYMKWAGCHTGSGAYVAEGKRLPKPEGGYSKLRDGGAFSRRVFGGSKYVNSI